ncbi:hypothetical protein KY290_033845 [Solanum tuberosum]|uniref:DUF4283 domain-containing protein n=1 Tax=Solanum tuberosum TaxID=4113 RepID=A0ABQ7U1J2_SOLTU|nr:hypothetical protein KY289_033221 [Solanum tuberosum]KAH0647858.1 hypothetical protein KY285_033106 [Solanum tuberosum]KAH0740802.1 hypothetical protein KY290_033845 [Solanum tuberosum]
MTIEGQLMRIQTWTPTFRLEQETPIVSVWVALPELSWHCYKKEFVSILLKPIGKVLYLDSPTTQKTRGSVARVNVQIYLTKVRPPHVWMGIDEDDYNIGRWQQVQYEGVPEYCMYCRHQGHHEYDCNIKKKDEEHKKKKEAENEKKNKTKPEQGKDNRKEKDNQNNREAGQITRDTNQQPQPGHSNNQQEEQWQVQRGKHIKTNHNSEDRSTSPQDKTPTNTRQQQQGKDTIINHNTYINLDSQDQSNNQENEVVQISASKSVKQNHVGEGSGKLNQPTSPKKQKKQITEAVKELQGSKHAPGNSDNIQNREVTKDTGIDTVLPSPTPLNNDVCIVAEEAVGGMEGRAHEIHTNLQDGVSKRGRELTHVLYEVVDNDHRNDSRAPATPNSNQHMAGQQEVQKENDMITDTGQQKSNNKSRGKLSKKKRAAIKKRLQKKFEQESKLTDKGKQTEEQVANKVRKGRQIQDDYGALNSEDELDPDSQSIEEYDEEDEELSNHLIQAFGSTFHDECPEEVRELTEQHGLSPRGRKQHRQTKHQATNNTSAAPSRPITRSKSKGF